MTLFILFSLLASCEGKNSLSESISYVSNETSSSYNEELSNSSYSLKTSSSITKIDSMDSNLSSNQDENSSLSDEEIYNSDGTKHFPPPNKNQVEKWSQTETIYDFSFSFPIGFSYFYGNNILNNPSFYAKGGWKITIPNSMARMGFQTPFFEPNLKLEIRFYLSEINNSNNKVIDNVPWIRVYGFSKEGIIVQSKEVNCPSNFKNYENAMVHFYMSGENVSYLEVRFISAPYKGSQCYNFGIKAIGFKTFPYAYNE